MCIRDSSSVHLGSMNMLLLSMLKLTAQVQSRNGCRVDGEVEAGGGFGFVEREGCRISFETCIESDFERLEIALHNLSVEQNTLIPMYLSLIHICRCRRYAVCRSRWSPYH
eukprot:TRINITY_DN13562_c0_g1_i2.p2 TRINITY_DN13562_c0_g1~~TRINITY_DN13562_c0_g1_i2.p2  ORF type:complete len:111 (+),score=7.08 TRINITY_DN13562_c0_g1_i2:68-400(+)